MDWRKIGLMVVIAGVLLSVPAGASAALLGTYTPPDNDVNDLDHHMLYAWRITDASLGSKTVTSATLTFNKMYNWDNTLNMLNLWLFNNARNASGTPVDSAISGSSSGCTTVATGVLANTATGCLTQYQDDTTANATLHVDDFGIAGLASQTNWLIDSADMTGGDRLSVQGFSGPGVAPIVPVCPAGTPAGGTWCYTPAGTGGNEGNTGPATINLYNYVYTFSTSDLASLNAYLSPGDNTFAIGLDPDCHYFNSGMTLELFDGGTVTTTAAVPEPATWLLIGTGMALLARRRLTGRTR